MRKTCILTALALMLVTATAGAVGIGVGVFGGASIPVVNDLSKRGTQFGVRVPVSVPMLTVEPFYAKSSLGDVEENFGGPVTFTRDGGEVTAFGANAILSMGPPAFRFFPFAGIGSYKLKREGAEDISKAGYQFGLGVGIAPPGLMGLAIDVRGEFSMIPTDQTSQKFANVTAGVSYKIFSTP
jgi:opacity protein-like surface antigen